MQLNMRTKRIPYMATKLQNTEIGGRHNYHPALKIKLRYMNCRGNIFPDDAVSSE